MKKALAVLAVGSLLSLNAFAADLVVEEFTHADGNLVGQTPSPGPGVAWAAHSGSGNKAIQVAGNTITLVQSSGSGEDVNTSFTAIGAGEKLYAGFDLVLPSGQTVDPDTAGLYFAHFALGTGTFRGRIFIETPSFAGDFGIGLDADGTEPSVTWATDLSFDTSYRLVVSYDYDSGDSQLWIDATVEGDTSITDAVGTASTAIVSFAFRQSNDYTGSQVIDNLQVSTTFAEAVPVELLRFDVE